MPKRLPRSRTLKGDPKLVYYDSGTGSPAEPPIVLLHGATFRSEDWENIYPRLATRYRVIAYDARGHGKSGRAADYGISALADDLLRVIDTLATGNAIVIGHSLGGARALVAAARRPAAIRALVLEEPVIANWDRDWRAEYYARVRQALASNSGTYIWSRSERRRFDRMFYVIFGDDRVMAALAAFRDATPEVDSTTVLVEVVTLLASKGFGRRREMARRYLTP